MLGAKCPQRTEKDGEKMKKGKKMIVPVIAVLTICVGAFAADGIVNIAVNYDTVKQIIVNHEEVALPEGEEPFEYNGRTYVPLRFVSEALGKQVGWDGYNGIVSIVDGIPRGELVFENDLSSENKWKIWDETTSAGRIYPKDGALFAEYSSTTGLVNFLSLRPECCPLPMSKFTMEIDILMNPNEKFYNGSLDGGFMIGQYRAWSSKYYAEAGLAVGVNGDENTENAYLTEYGGVYIPCNRYVTLSVVFDENKEMNMTYIDTYIDGELLREKYSEKLIEEMLGPTQTFNTIGIYSHSRGVYFKNFKIYCND